MLNISSIYVVAANSNFDLISTTVGGKSLVVYGRRELICRRDHWLKALARRRSEALIQSCQPSGRAPDPTTPVPLSPSNRACRRQTRWRLLPRLVAAPRHGRLRCAAVLAEHQIEVRRLLVCLVLTEVGRAPAHDAGIENAPDAGADVACMEPHT
jgi:hypothetical protein